MDKKDLVVLLMECEKIKFHDLERHYQLSRHDAIAISQAINQEVGDVIGYTSQYLYLTSGAVERLNQSPHYWRDVRDSVPRSIWEIILLLRLLVVADYFPLDEAVEILDVSKNTALRIIKDKKEVLGKRGIELGYNRRAGYYLEGTDESFWRLITELTTSLLMTSLGRYALLERGLLTVQDIREIRMKLDFLERKCAMRFADASRDRLPYILALLIKRIKAFGGIRAPQSALSDVQGTYEFDTIRRLFWHVESLSAEDLAYLTVYILSENVNDAPLDVDQVVLTDAVNSFIQSLEENALFHFDDKVGLAQSLLLHMRPLINRAKLGLHVMNPLRDQFVGNYPLIFTEVKQHFHCFDRIFQEGVSDDELALVAMIVLSYIQGIRRSEEHGLTAYVICQNGQSISRMLLVELQQLFPQIQFLGARSIRDYYREMPVADFIFSTVPLAANQSLYLVKSLMSDQEKLELRRLVEQELQADPKKKIKGILHALVRVVPAEYEEQLKEGLQHYFHMAETPPAIRGQNLLTSSSQVEQVAHLDWDGVVQRVLRPMVARQTISQGYLEAVDLAFNHDYLTQVIADGVLLPHGHPDQGVLEVDVQLLFCPNGFLAPNGQRFWLIIGLAPGRLNQHVDWLIFINRYLNQQANRERLQSLSRDQLYQALKEGFDYGIT